MCRSLSSRTPLSRLLYLSLSIYYKVNTSELAVNKGSFTAQLKVSVSSHHFRPLEEVNKLYFLGLPSQSRISDFFFNSLLAFPG